MPAPVRLGILGLNFGRHIVDALTAGPARNWVDLKQVCDRDRDRAETVGGRAGVRTSYDLDELLANRSLEAVGVFTGPVGRADLVRKIIRAGKHVITTKPFEIDPDAALDVLNEARRLGRVVHLNSPGPQLPPTLRQALAWQNDFKLGRPVGCRRDVWAAYRETPDGSWYDDPDHCPVAPIFRLGIYMINDMIRLMGEVESVQVTHSRLFTQRPTPDNAQLTLRFTSGAIGNIFASFCVSDGCPYGNSMVLNYEHGTVYQNVTPSAMPLPEPRRLGMTLVTADPSGAPTARHAYPEGESGQYQWDAFCRAVRGESLADETTPAEVVAGLRVIRAMMRAERSGATEPV